MTHWIAPRSTGQARQTHTAWPLRTATAIIVLLIIALPIAAQTTLAPARDTVITVVHTNDTHGRVAEAQFDGMGFARIAGKVQQLRDAGSNVLLLDAGDTFHGTTFVGLSRGESILRILNAMQYDALTAGNHDFNYGTARLLELAGMAQFPVLGANVTRNGQPVLTPYLIREFGPLKVAVFGLTTTETYYKTHPSNITGVTFEDPIATARRLVAELRTQAHVVIALAHLGIDEDTTDITARELAQQVPGIDLIVDGHSHSVLPNGLVINGTPIVQAGQYDQALGIVEVEYRGGRVTRVTPSLIMKADAGALPEHPRVLALIDEAQQDNRPILEEVVTQTAEELDGQRSSVRTRQTNLSRLIAAAMLDISGADVALMNGGGIRTSIKAGPVTRGDIISVLPFGNTTVVIEVTGADIIAALEHGLGAFPNESGGFAQTGGIEFDFNAAAPAGNRTSNWRIAGRPLDRAATYRLVTNDFLAAGGDQYTMLRGKTTLAEFGTLDEVLIGYMNR